MEKTKHDNVFLTDGGDGDSPSSGRAQSERTHGKCGGGIDCTDQLSGCNCFEMYGHIGLLLMMKLFSHCI